MNDVSHYSQEREALKALYVFADGSRWRMKSKWSKDGGTSMNFGDMYGVEVASSLIEENNASIGDVVTVKECKPFSKTKTWVLVNDNQADKSETAKVAEVEESE